MQQTGLRTAAGTPMINESTGLLQMELDANRRCTKNFADVGQQTILLFPTQAKDVCKVASLAMLHCPGQLPISCTYLSKTVRSAARAVTAGVRWICEALRSPSQASATEIIIAWSRACHGITSEGLPKPHVSLLHIPAMGQSNLVFRLCGFTLQPQLQHNVFSPQVLLAASMSGLEMLSEHGAHFRFLNYNHQHRKSCSDFFLQLRCNIHVEGDATCLHQLRRSRRHYAAKYEVPNH